MSAEGEREPCPFRIFEDMGGGFLLGSVGGAVWHFVKGYRNAPRQARWSGALTAARMRAPILGGNFGVWGGLFSVFDCSLAHFRKTEDAWNAILAGGLTGGTLAARAGGKAIVRNAAGGVVILALIEGVMMLVNKFITKVSMGPQGGAAFVDKLEPPIDPPGTEDFAAAARGGAGAGRHARDSALMLR
jgi:import inner membrane translocase subunit TIM17